MKPASLSKRYKDFCEDAQNLLKTSGFAHPEQTPTIIGLAFKVACDKLATIHFPEDYLFGVGPRGILHEMYVAFNKTSDDLPGALAVAEVLRGIIKRRPPLDIDQSKDTRKRLPQGTVADVQVCPFYDKKHKYDVRARSVFVLMPFCKPWSDRIWNDHIQPYLGKAPDGKKLIVRRANDMYGQAVMEDIYEGILTAALVLAECTGRNANVLYELGIAHSFGKRTALLSQDATDIPFDLQRFRFCIYADNSSGYPKLKQFLEETVREVFG